MKEQQELHEIERMTYKDKTIILYRETFVVDGVAGPEEYEGLCARITPTSDTLGWQTGLIPNRESIFEAFKELIDARKL